MSQPDVDGHIYTGHRDPPGQSSVYIGPGDAWRENYRLSTFVQYPSETPVIPVHLASSGFYFTGYKDRVKCFSCGLCVENWVHGDDPSEKKWHRSDCEYANGTDTYNIPLTSAFARFRKNVTSPKRHAPTYQGPSHGYPSTSSQRHNDQNHSLQTPASPTVTNGFPESSKRGNHNQETVPHEVRTAETAGLVSPNSNRNEIIPNGERENPEMFPCLAPVNPHMESVTSRLGSFREENGTRWPRENLSVTEEEIAAAGFFFLGERDRVKCWYCNGGLQNWDYDDIPWEQHAKWFPTCEFLLRKKGLAFVQSVNAEFPNLSRPTPSTVLPTPRRPSPIHSTQSSRMNGSTSPPSEASINITIEKAMNELDYVKQAREMQISNEAIRAVLKRKYVTNGKFYSTGEEFLDAILSFGIQSTSSQATTSTSTTQAPVETTPNATTPPQKVDELLKLEQSRRCKACKNKKANIALIPCGHLAACESCSPRLSRCPVCNARVQERIRTFRA